VAQTAQRVGEFVQVRGPVGEDEAGPALGQRGCHVGDDLQGPRLVGDQVLVDDGDAARRGRAGVPGVAVPGRVEVEYESRAFAWVSAGQRRDAIGGPSGTGDGMPDLTDLHGDEVVELVAPVRGGGQSKPAPDRDLLDGVLEGGRWHVVALVGDDQAVSGSEISDIVTAGQGQPCCEPVWVRRRGAGGRGRGACLRVMG
jgi:hypothetical protein